MGRKIKIPLSLFPSDREIHDLAMSSLITPKKIQEVLLKFGIVIQSKERKPLADALSSLILDHEQMSILLEHTNVREGRVKTSVVELSIPGADINDVLMAMQEAKIPLADTETRIKIDSLSTPTYIKETETIELTQQFQKIDYSKNILIQEEPNEFSIKVEKQSSSVVRLTCSTSNTASEFYFKAIKEEVLRIIKEKKPQSDPYFREILASDIPAEKINEFFNTLINSGQLSLTLSHVTTIHMTKPENLADGDPDEIVVQDETEEDIEKDEVEETVIKQLKFHGKNLLKHDDIQKKVAEGFVIKSLEAIFYADEDMGSRKWYLISIGFGVVNKFFSEIKSCEVETSDSKKKDKINLPTSDREACLSPLNTEAFVIFESLIETDEVAQKQVQEDIANPEQ